MTINAEKKFLKLKHLFTITTFNQLGIAGKFPDLINGLYDKPKANSIIGLPCWLVKDSPANAGGSGLIPG